MYFDLTRTHPDGAILKLHGGPIRLFVTVIVEQVGNDREGHADGSHQ